MAVEHTFDTPIPQTLAGKLARSVGPLLGGVFLAVAAQLWIGPWLGEFMALMLMNIGIWTILAVSLNIVNGFTGQFSIGHAGFMAIGGYTAGMVTHYGALLIWGTTARHGGWLGSGEMLFAAGCLAGGIVAALAGYLVGLPTLRLRGDYLAIVTLGFGEIIRVLLQQTKPVITTVEQLKAAKAEQLFPPPVGGAQGFALTSYTNLFWIFLFASLTVLAAHRLKHSSTGRAMISIREDEIAAAAMGINTTRLKVRAFIYSAFFAGIAGGLFAHETGVVIQPQDAGFQRSFDLVIMVVLGGMGSISGVILSATVLSILPELLRGFNEYRLIVYALLLILVMVLRPQGLFGVHEIWDYLPRRKKKAADARASS